VEIVAWTVAAVTGAGITAAVAVLTVRVVRRRRARHTLPQASYRAEPVIPPVRLAARPVEPPAGRPALSPPRQRPAGSWPLPGWWEEIRPRIGGDSDEHRPR
jgi:hypothetical protein